MKAKRRQSGLSLTEIALIIATIALLVGLSVPAVRAFIRSFETGSSIKGIINGALSNARAIAATEQKYAGIRFQKAYRPEGPLNAPQYMVFIINDSDDPPNGTGLANGFRAVEGLKPIKLPETVGVMDYTNIQGEIAVDPSWEFSSDPAIFTTEFTNLTTFSIIFSASGKLVIHEVRVRNKNGKIDSSPIQSLDDIFNTETQIINIPPYGMFYQDDYTTMGLGQEHSRNSFIIYEQKEFKQAYERGEAWSGYLSGLEPLYINAYMGTIIE